MKKIISNIIVIYFFFAIFVVNTTVSRESQNILTIMGTIISIDTASGKIKIKDESGTTVPLSIEADADIDIKSLTVGDGVIVKTNLYKNILSLVKMWCDS